MGDQGGHNTVEGEVQSWIFCFRPSWHLQLYFAYESQEDLSKMQILIPSVVEFWFILWGVGVRVVWGRGGRWGEGPEVLHF